MKATEFCEFFDFTIEKKEGHIDDVPCYEGTYNYIGVDNEGVFCNRYAKDIKEIADWFDSMLLDYVQTPLEEAGFEPPIKVNYWKAALEYIENKKDWNHSKLTDVVMCLIDPDLIEDDLL